MPLWLPVSRESLDERGHAVHNSVKGRRTKRRAWRRRTTVAKGGGFEDRRGGGVQFYTGSRLGGVRGKGGRQVYRHDMIVNTGMK